MTLPHDEVVDALNEWGRWATWRTYYGPRLPSCGSVESRYRSGQVWHLEDLRPDPPDWRLGERLERIVTGLDRRSHKVLAVWYCLRPALLREGATLVPDELTWAWRRAHIGSAERFLELLADAENKVGWTLDNR